MRVVIAEDSVLLQAGLTKLLTDGGFEVVAAVADDGRGGATLDGGGTGLRGLAQRATAVDGTLTVDSPPGGPTAICVELPCES